MFVACVVAPATDAPAPMLAKALPSVSPPAERPYHGERVQIRKAQAQIVSMGNPWIKRIVHTDDLEKLGSPILIYAEVVDRFSERPRTAFPVIVLNGQPLTNSIVVRGESDRVYAVAPSGVQLGSKMNIQVGWFGALSRTISSVVEISFDSVPPRE
jgi:hypothetical protein